MTPDQAIEAAKLARICATTKARLDDIEARLKKLGVEIPPGK